MSELIGASTRQVIRVELVELLFEASDLGLSKKIICNAIKKSFDSVLDSDIDVVLLYLEEKGLINKKDLSNKKLGIQMVVYTITAKGMDYLEGSIVVEGMD